MMSHPLVDRPRSRAMSNAAGMQASAQNWKISQFGIGSSDLTQSNMQPGGRSQTRQKVRAARGSHAGTNCMAIIATPIAAASALIFR